ncbi:MAG: segregation/condensation protein A [Spirochaetaceae bacterium]|jgi:segregation and condensation protein A|nr:segregation/condensation protein A [Spirochaetaceae bacterium]
MIYYPMDDSAGKARFFRVSEFEGPLDLLLFLIRKNEVNIYDIPIAQITEQYLTYLSFATELDLEDLTEFHSLAATLLYIKSRMLLPVEVSLDDDAEDPRQELVDKLIEYQKFKKLSELMEEKEREAEWVIGRKRLQRPLPFVEEDLWTQVDIWDLLRTFSGLMSNLGDQRILDLYEEVSINEKITLIGELLERKGEFSFTDLVVRSGSLLDIICAFLAVLESVKSRLIVIFQNRMFGDILIRPRGAVPAVPPGLSGSGAVYG